ncbi:MAG: translation initiation factor IF-2 [Actinobacteria bacterium]|nr:MAG: translation initiation factor IF-2 [Actinomycetota bacterium]TMK66001.1 MAG: translation initiation factor IF-2 [Actinomycetota bacterium]
MRVHELAKELGVTSKDLLAALEAMGFEGRTASSSVPDEAVPRLRASGGKAVPGAKPRAAREEPVAKSRARPKAKAEPEPDVKPKPAAKATAARPDGAATATVAVPAVAPAAQAKPAPAAAPAKPALPSLKVVRGSSAQDLAEKVGRTPADIVKILLSLGEMVTATQSLSDEAITLVATELGYEAEVVGFEEEQEEEQVDESRLRPRPPVVTVMGHVDHGKTLLLDAIRKTDVVSQEFGGITQHIGAYQVHVDGREITFIDTPGHEAFTAMRARGAQVTDIAVLVVAADDGVKPQTVEALDHVRAAGVPIIVAVNKVDKPESDPQRVRQQMVELGVVPAEWGGTVEFVDVSAKARTNLDSLLETILLVADLEELKADPEGRARGAVIDANLDKGRGAVASVLVQKGSLDVGDALVAGSAWAKVRAMLDENGRPVKQAGPSKPVQILGWSSVPNAGDDFREVQDEREARHLAQEREAKFRAAELVTSRPPTLQELMAQARQAEVPDLNLVVKADVQGSLGAVMDAFLKLPQDEVRVNIIHGATGGITESDIALAVASDAIVVGFNVRPDANARELADREGVDVRLYRVIYEAIDDIRSALSGMLKPEEHEIELGRAEVRTLFRVPRVGVVAGSYVVSGNITRNSRARVVRDGVVVYEGRIGSLRRFKDDVREVAEGFECGISIENFQDVHEGDIIEAYEVREVARQL